jgi:cob(I)alamin adenosyltransferase
MKIYTKAGDGGQTRLLGGRRVGKDHARVEAYGTVDELNAVLGRARTENPEGSIDRLLESIQHDLFAVGAELASTGTVDVPVADCQVAALENVIDREEQHLAPLTQFILPGGTPLSATLHLARTVCRRAERRVVALHELDGEHVSDVLVRYLNRLGDLLFVLARRANAIESVPDVPWRPDAGMIER